MTEINTIEYDPAILDKIQEMNNSSDLIPHLGIKQEDIDKRMKYYFSIPQPAQKSQEWLNQRTNYITASALENAISPLWSAKRNELLRNKVSRGTYNNFHGNEATRWGEKFEDVANAVYCYRQNTTVEEFGLIPHYNKDLRFLAGSTDGISARLINLEIKCPFSRTIKPGIVPHHYWKQMQLQMEVLDLELSHFLECRFNEANSKEDFYVDYDHESWDNPERGIIIEVVRFDQTNLAGEPKTAYLYSPMHLCENKEALDKWETDNIDAIVADESQMVYIRSHYWFLEVCSCVNVARDREWFNSKIPEMQDFWNDVEKYRANGGLEKLNEDIEAANIKKKIEKGVPGADGICLILDSGSETSSSNSSSEVVKEENGYLIVSSDEDEDEDENKEDSSKRNDVIISSDEESENNKGNNKEKKPKKEQGVQKDRFDFSSESEKEGELEKDKDSIMSSDVNVNRNEKVSYVFSSSEDEDEEEGDIHDKIQVKLSKINLEISDRLHLEKQKKKGGDTGPNRPTLILTPSHSTNSSSVDIDYEGDVESSGSDTDNDSPPLRPPSETKFRRWKKNKSGSKSKK